MGLGHEVEIVPDGEFAWWRLRTSPFDVAMVDPSLVEGEFPLVETMRGAGVLTPVAIMPYTEVSPEWTLRWFDQQVPAIPFDLETLSTHVRNTVAPTRSAQPLLID
ncbi:MAG TPA: hypothetical protein VHH73_06585 [Verrucomicrobiae bacterium]|nr:hypothetical protein [Verrucomicrobiae bacterium]